MTVGLTDASSGCTAATTLQPMARHTTTMNLSTLRPSASERMTPRAASDQITENRLTPQAPPIFESAKGL